MNTGVIRVFLKDMEYYDFDLKVRKMCTQAYNNVCFMINNIVTSKQK